MEGRNLQYLIFYPVDQNQNISTLKEGKKMNKKIENRIIGQKNSRVEKSIIHA